MPRKGSKKPGARTHQVQTFKPKHDQIVMLHLAGYDNREIKEMTGICETTVSSILNHPQALALIEAGRQRMRENLLQSIDDRLLGLASRSVENLEKTLNSVPKLGTTQKRHQDRVSLDVLGMIGYGKPKANENSGRALSDAMAEKLSNALEKAQKVQEIQVIEATVVDAAS